MSDGARAGSCTGVARQVERLLDGGLGRRDAGALRSHLRACLRCRDEYARRLRARRALRALTPCVDEAFDDTFFAELRRDVERAVAQPDERGAAPIARGRLRRTAAAAAALFAVGLGLGAVLGGERGPVAPGASLLARPAIRDPLPARSPRAASTRPIGYERGFGASPSSAAYFRPQGLMGRTAALRLVTGWDAEEVGPTPGSEPSPPSLPAPGVASRGQR
jgi:hypothetical protein